MFLLGGASVRFKGIDNVMFDYIKSGIYLIIIIVIIIQGRTHVVSVLVALKEVCPLDVAVRLLASYIILPPGNVPRPVLSCKNYSAHPLAQCSLASR